MTATHTTGSAATADVDVSAVLAAAADVVAAYGSHEPERYFGCFTEDATFVFHTTPGVISCRAQYERMWADWEREGFRVLGCRSLEPRAQVVGADSAVFTHRVRTTLAGVIGEACERETMVFVRTDDDRWLAVHEHLSADPDSSDPDGTDPGGTDPDRAHPDSAHPDIAHLDSAVRSRS